MTAPTLSTFTPPRPVMELWRSLIPVICPPDTEELGLVDSILEEALLSLRAFPMPFRAALVAGSLTYDQGARLWPGARGRRAAELRGDVARRYFHSWWTSRLIPRHEFARAVKSLLCLAAYESDPFLDRIGYTATDWIDRVREKRISRFGPVISAHRQELFAPDPLPEATFPEETSR